MEIITVTKENLNSEHICCAISNEKDSQVVSKKTWMSERFEDGLVFKKANVRGKCFIEYIPAEYAWSPIDAEGYMYIDCLWVSGQFKGQGYSNLLLKECIEDSREKGKKGLVILSTKKKMPYVSDPEFLTYKGFQVADTAEPYYQLMYLPFEMDAPKPAFKPRVKHPKIEQQGYVLYYAGQCPFNAKYVPLLQKAAEENGILFQAVRFESTEEAQNAPAPYTSYSLFYDGEFVTNELLSDKKFVKMIKERMG